MSAIKMAHSAAPKGLRDRDEALRCFVEALEQNPNDSFTHHKLGLLYEEEFRDREKARECFERAIETNSRNAPAYNSLGLLHKATNKHLALEYFRKSISVDPEYGRAHKNMGLLFLHEFNDLTRAREAFAECLRVDPNNASAYVTMGQMCERQKEHKAAEQYYEMSIQCDSRNPIGYFRLGVLKEMLKDLHAAKQQYELAVRANPTDVRFLAKLAKLVEREPFKDYYLARKCYRTALRHNPDEVWLTSRIQFIETRLLPQGEDGNPLPIPPEHDAVFEEETTQTPLGSAIEMQRQTSSMSNDDPKRCPRRHPLAHICAKPLTYKPQATWACEECHKSIGGLDLRINGAFHCAICKYDLCAACSGKPKTAHVIPDEPTLIGSGGFGEVYREYDPTSETYVAVKYIRTPNPRDVQAVQKEVRIMRLFSASPFIVKVLRLDVERRQCRVFLELMAGSVASVIDHNGPVHETQARVWIYDALCGLATLHNATRPVLHRDIKPENLLLTADGRVKLSDFGLSKNVEATAKAQTIGPKGTPLYVAPECYQDPPRFTYACDIWGLACSWICMVSGYHPWHGVFRANACFENIGWRLGNDETVTPGIPEHLTPECQSLLRRMLDRDRRKRLTAEMVLADDYFSRADLLERAEPVADFERRRDAFIQENRANATAQESEGHAGGESGQMVMVDGVSLMTPATPTAMIEPGGGLFPAIDTSSVIPAAPSVQSWGSVGDMAEAGSAHNSSPTGRGSTLGGRTGSTFSINMAAIPSSPAYPGGRGGGFAGAAGGASSSAAPSTPAPSGLPAKGPSERSFMATASDGTADSSAWRVAPMPGGRAGSITAPSTQNSNATSRRSFDAPPARQPRLTSPAIAAAAAAAACNGGKEFGRPATTPPQHPPRDRHSSVPVASPTTANRPVSHSAVPMPPPTTAAGGPTMAGSPTSTEGTASPTARPTPQGSPTDTEHRGGRPGRAKGILAAVVAGTVFVAYSAAGL